MPLIIDCDLPDVSSMQVTHSNIPPGLRIRNRRKRYLDAHPEYFGSSLEIADPLLYDRLIRRFQSPAERESEVRQKGYAGTLETDLLRSEAKLAEAEAVAETGSKSAATDSGTGVTYTRSSRGEIHAIVSDYESLTRSEAAERWEEVMRARFLAGKDVDFEYVLVDESEAYDDRRVEDLDREDEWFDGEIPDSAPRSGEEEGGGGEKRVLKGETGVQDF